MADYERWSHPYLASPFCRANAWLDAEGADRVGSNDSAFKIQVVLYFLSVGAR
jgi:hypothetical protein